MKHRLLLVDDDPTVLRALQRHLTQRYNVVLAPNGQQALEALRTEGPFTVVVSDIRMPGMSGALLVEQASRQWPDTTYFLLSGNEEAERMSLDPPTGVAQVLFKPCTVHELETMVAEACQRIDRRAITTAKQQAGAGKCLANGRTP